MKEALCVKVVDLQIEVLEVNHRIGALTADTWAKTKSSETIMISKIQRLKALQTHSNRDSIKTQSETLSDSLTPSLNRCQLGRAWTKSTKMTRPY